jgi:glutamyl-tRNA(Gln) amidotransferase subunit E
MTHPRFTPEDDYYKLDYQALEFKCGLEIHQQLLTEKKLFCRCPAGLYSQEHHAEVLRHMRPTLSELGEYDGTALMEFKTKKDIIYLLNRDSVCTYELDDNPPFAINQQALDIALEIALLLNCNIVGELHVSRKQYLDGSIPAGFQRTAIVGVDGWVPYKDRKIGIIQLGLEEDACREVSDIGHTITFRTDRLSMPLVEVVTYPHMRTPQEVADVGWIIAHLLRCTGKIRRGIGTVRQDVNVSIAGGTRVEIKGVPRIPLFPRLTHNEAYRQVKLLEIRDEIHRRGIKTSGVTGDFRDLTDALKDTRHPLLSKALRQGLKIKGVAVRGFNGILNMITQPGLTFDHELSGRVRVIACLDKLPNIAHTDQTGVHGIRGQDRKILTQEFSLSDHDVCVLCWGSEDDAQTGVQEILIRCQEAASAIPNETRQARRDGRSDFERILPGPNRMYPDTDSPPTAIDDQRIERIQTALPTPPWVREKAYRELGLSHDLAHKMSLSPHGELFDKSVNRLKIPPVRAAVVLTDHLKSAARKGSMAADLRDESLYQLFQLFAEGQFSKEAFPRILETVHSPAPDFDAIVKSLNLTPVSQGKLDRAIDRVLKTPLPKGVNTTAKTIRFYMGRLMSQYRGRIDGKQLFHATSQRLTR